LNREGGKDWKRRKKVFKSYRAGLAVYFSSFGKIEVFGWRKLGNLLKALEGF